MYCKQCGKEVENGVNFCSNCGADLQEKKDIYFDAPTVDPVNQQINEKRKPSVIGIVGFGIAMFSSFFFLFLTISLEAGLPESIILFSIFTLFTATPAFILSVIGLTQSNKEGLKLKGFSTAGTIVSAIYVFIAFICCFI